MTLLRGGGNGSDECTVCFREECCMKKGVMTTKHAVTIVYRECSAKVADSILDSQDKDRQWDVLTCSLNCLKKDPYCILKL